jgi:hypothetical protein
MGAGYVYDAAIDNWRNAVGTPVPIIRLWTPTYEVAPTEGEHGRRFVEECQEIGLTSIIHEPCELSACMERVFGAADFDAYMMSWNLDRHPDHLYDMLHSSQDSSYTHGDTMLLGSTTPHSTATLKQ